MRKSFTPNTATPLGIHIDLRHHAGERGSNAIVANEAGSSLGTALSGPAWKNMGGALGTHDLCCPTQTRCGSVCLLHSTSSLRANFYDSARLWPSARTEVQAFVGLLPAIASSWTRGWCSSIVATDASEYGFGVCLKELQKRCLRYHWTDQ